MAKSKRIVKSFYRLLFPIVLLLILALTGASVWLFYTASIPPRSEYLVTPEKYGQVQHTRRTGDGRNVGETATAVLHAAGF